MATNKLFPPQLDGTLPAFYKSYNADNELVGANISIPFSLGRAISIIEINGISMRISTVSTNNLIATVTTNNFEITDDNIAYFTLEAEIAKKLNEGQYYRIQLAYIDIDEVVGYYSTVGVIKCIAKPTCSLNEFSPVEVNIFRTTLVGVYEQDTTFGDTTEKVYRYRFLLTDSKDNALVDSGWLLHDITQDTESETSRDIFNIYTELDAGEIGNIQYMVETINGLSVQSPIYEIMKMESVELEYPLEIYTKNDFDNGCINLYLHGVYNHTSMGEEAVDAGQEAVYSGTFVITRADEYSNYKEWREITRFIISGDQASHFGFRDFTVEQGVYYRYGIQQYNSNYMYSEKILSNDMTPYWIIDDSEKALSIAMQKAKENQSGPVRADFEDMFLFDGKRQLKIRFNPKMTSFKTTVLEQKTDTIGGKYPFIFKNGHTNYKEFPIGGLISYTADDSALFLYDKELVDAHILTSDQVRSRSNPYGAIPEYINGKLYRRNYTGTDKYAFIERMYWYNYIEERDPNTKIVSKKAVYTKYTDKELLKKKKIIDTKVDDVTLTGIVYYDPTLVEDYGTGYNRRDLKLFPIDSRIDARDVTGVVRDNRDLTSENVTAERYFKLKVLEWLNDGNIKLFKSPTEGNYLVRLINTQLQPQEQLGRLIHSFTSQAYEMDEISYDKLVYYKIITKATPIITSTLWKSIDLKTPLREQADNTFYQIDFERRIPLHLYFDDFMPGDTIRITFSDTSAPAYYLIGNTGNFDLNNEHRTILTVSVKKAAEAYEEYDPIEYSRILTYSYIGIGSSRFDAVFDLDSNIPVAETFVGPKENLLEPYSLVPTEEQYDGGKSYLATENKMVNGDDTNPGLKAIIASREHINFNLGPYANKFKALTFETLHARKRHIIPIYACENLEWDQENKQFKVQTALNINSTTGEAEQEGTLFCTTPFGVGYINSKLLYTIDSITHQVYAIEPEDLADANNIKMADIKQIEGNLPDFIGYYNEGYDILKVYVPKVIESSTIETIYSRGSIINNTINFDATLVGIMNEFSWDFNRNIECDQICIVTNTRKDIIRIKNTSNNNIDAVYTGKREYFIPTPKSNQKIYIQLFNVSGFDPTFYAIFSTNKHQSHKIIPAMKDDTLFYDNYKKYTDQGIMTDVLIPDGILEDISNIQEEIKIEYGERQDEEWVLIDQIALSCYNRLQYTYDIINSSIDGRLHIQNTTSFASTVNNILEFLATTNIDHAKLKAELNSLLKIDSVNYTALVDINQPNTVYNQYYDAWEENPDKNYLYYDTYTHSWWPAGQEYDPTFTITDIPQWNKNIIYTPVHEGLENSTLYSNPLVLIHPNGFSTFPVYDENNSDIPGIILGKDPSEGKYDEILAPIIDAATGQVTSRVKLGNGQPVYLYGSGINTIDLSLIDEFVINDMKAPDRLRIGSGVIVEVTPRLQIVEYNVEHQLNECYDYKKAYLERKQKYWDLLVSTYKDASALDIKTATYRRLVELINDSQAQIDKLQNAINETNILANALIDRLTTVTYNMYLIQNNYLNYMYELIREIELPRTMEDTQADFVKLLPSAIHDDYLAYIGMISDNYTLNNNTIYNRNYYYNTRIGQFYYNSNPDQIDSVLVPSDTLSFYQREITDDNGHSVTKWGAGTVNGVYTLWQSTGDGDIYYNTMLQKLLYALFGTQLPNTEKNVYDLMQSLYDEIGRIPASIHTYGDYRAWLRTLLNAKTGQAYALIHYYDTIPEDVDYIILNDANHLMEINEIESNVEIQNHPYTSAYMKYDMTTMTNGLLYMYLNGSKENVYENANLITKIQYDARYKALFDSLEDLEETNQGPLKNTTILDATNEMNLEAQILIENYNLQPSICKHNCKVTWNIEKDYYYEPYWLEIGTDGHGPGFYGVYMFTDIGRQKVRTIDRETFVKYNAAVTEFNNLTEVATEEYKSNIVKTINDNFNLLLNSYNENNPHLELCLYNPTGTTTMMPEQVTYEIIEKYPRDYYYDIYGRVIFNNSGERFFDYPINLINPYNEENNTYYLDYLGDNTIDFWSQVNGLLVDDPKTTLEIPEDVKKDSALEAYYTFMDDHKGGGFAKNTILADYYQWQETSLNLSTLQQEYYDWSQGLVSRAGYTGSRLVDIEPIEEEWESLRSIYNDLQYQMRSAVTILITETDAGRMTARKRNELIDLISNIIDQLGISEKDFINFCGLNLNNSTDKELLAELKVIKNDLNDSIFDQEDIFIEQVNQLFYDNSYSKTIGYITDRNGNIYTYDSYVNLVDRDAKMNLRLALPEDVINQIDNLISQINAYNNKYKEIRYKYMIRNKYNELYNVNNAVILRIRDSFLEEIKSYQDQAEENKKAYLNKYGAFVEAVYLLNKLFWDETPTDLGINALILKYQETIKNKKKDTDSLNDSSIAGAIHNYWYVVDEVLRYFYATQLHNKKDIDDNDLIDTNYNIGGSTQINYIDPETQEEKSTYISNDDYNNSDDKNYLEKNADSYYDDYLINYELLQSLNDIQISYTDLINELEENKAAYQNQQAQLGWDESQIPSDVNLQQEKAEIETALAWYLASLGYRYYAEVEELYKR